MTGEKTRFASERAPCGKAAEGERYREVDGEGLVFSDLYYDCGCRRIHHEFHDGSIRVQVLRHDGVVLAEDVSPEHGS